MATEKRASFPILEVLATGAGAPWHTAVEDDTHVGRNAAPALIAVNAADELKYLRVNLNGELIVADPDSDFACLDSHATLEDGSAVLALVTEITLQNSKTYRDLELAVSCYRDTKFIVEHVDDEGGVNTVTPIFIGRLTAGEATKCCRMECMTFASGAVGVQKLRIRAVNQNTTSDIDGTLAIKEVQTL